MLATPNLASAACDAPSTNVEVRAATREVVFAFEKLDLEGLESADGATTELAGCLREVILPDVAAAVHRAAAMRAFVERNEERAQRAFRASHRLDPEFDYPERSVPKGNPLRAAFHAGKVLSTSTEPLPKLEPTYKLLLDGLPANSRAVAEPVLLQLQGPSGIESSWRLEGNAPLPELPLAKQEPIVSSSSPSLRTPVRVLGVALLGAAAGLGGASVWSYNDTDSWSDAKRSRTNTLGVGAYSLGALGAVATGVSFALPSGN